MEKSQGRIELRQANTEEVSNLKPNFLLRWGLTIFLIILVFVFSLSNFISYPDIIVGEAEVTTINPPVSLVAPTSGKLQELFVMNGQLVEENSPILQLESVADLKDVIKAENIIKEISDRLEDRYSIVEFDFQRVLTLGKLQLNYSQLVRSYEELLEFYLFAIDMKKIQSLTGQLNHHIQYLEKVLEKRRILVQSVEIGKKNLLRDKALYDQRVISEKNFDLSRIENDINLKSKVADLNIELARTKLRKNGLENEIQELMVGVKIQERSLIVELRESILMLKAEIDVWRSEKIVVSPINGKINFLSFLDKNQYIKKGNIVLAVIPADSSSNKARIMLPIRNSGKISIGNQVTIKLDNYPYQEFGMLVGKLEAVSQVPIEVTPGKFVLIAEVSLSDDTRTSYNIKLPKMQKMFGRAEVHTDELSLLSRFFSPIKALYDEQRL